MKTSFVRLFVAILAMVFVAGCKEKKEENVIITTKPKVVEKKDTVCMEKIEHNVSAKWRGSEYNIGVVRHTDKSLAITEDESENKYYDNRIVLKIVRPDGTTFLNREFVKSDFKDKVSEEFYGKKALVGFVFDKVDGSNLRFAASLGSPDKFSDDFIPFDVFVSPSGDVSIQLSQQNLIDSSREEDI